MLNTYDTFTLNAIFQPNAFIKKKHALQYQIHSLCSTILYLHTFRKELSKSQKSMKMFVRSTNWWNRDYLVDIEVHVFS